MTDPAKPNGLRVLPFLPRFHEAVREGRKTMTCRTKKYGQPGDCLQGPGVVLRLLKVTDEPLAGVAKDHWREEGCASPAEFQRIWEELHPRTGWDPERLVWLHEFEVVP